MQKTKQVIYKEHFFLWLIFFCLILIPNVNAVIPETPDNVTWSEYDQSLYQGYAYTDTLVSPLSVDEAQQYCLKKTGSKQLDYSGGHNNSKVTKGTYTTGSTYAPTCYIDGTLAGCQEVDGIRGIYGGVNGRTSFQSVYCTAGSVHEYRKGWWIDYAINTPKFYYHNITIKTQNDLNWGIPRVNVELEHHSGVGSIAVLQGLTDLNGEVYFGYVSELENTNITIKATKVGYENIEYQLSTGSEDSVYNVELTLYDITSPLSGNDASLALDIVDELQPLIAVKGATIGIKNVSTGGWSYATYPESTIIFTNDGNGNNLSVGQTVQFAGYKTNAYASGHTEEFTLLSPKSTGVLSLTKITETNITTNETIGLYSYPVSVVDAVTGNTISNARLNVSLFNVDMLQETNWYNSSSPTGKFTITGYGNKGLIPIQTDDVVNLYAEADGYESNGWGLIASSKNNGITQIRPLMPLGNIPISGEFNVQVLVTDNDNLKMLGGVVLEVTGGGNTKTQITGNGGSSVFYNLTSGTTYNIKATAYGYTTTSQTFSGSSGQTSYVDFFLSKSSMNPIYTIEPTPYYTLTPSITYPIVTPKAWDNTKASTCKEIPKNATFMEFMKIKIACLGFDTATSQSLVIAGLIIMFFVMFGSKYGKGIGAAIGAIIGFVLAYALGVIPFAILALIIAILVLLSAIMIGSKFINSGG